MYNYNTRIYIKKPFKAAVIFLDDISTTGDIVTFSNHSAQVPFQYYGHKNQSIPYYLLYIEQLRKNEYPALKQAKRIWFIESPWGGDGTADLTDKNSPAVKEYLDNNFRLLFFQRLDGLIIHCYINK